MSRIMLSLLTAVVLASASWTHAADAKWFELKDFGPVTQRVAVTVENPADVANDAAVVRIPLADLAKTLPDAKNHQVCVVDPAHKPAKRDAADLEFVPFQVSHDVLIFMLPLKAKEKKPLHIYTAPQRLNLPGIPRGTSYDSRHAYRSFENRFAAFRIETGPGSNTTGMTVDAFGKTKAGIGLRLAEMYQTGHDSYHKLSYWGIDILKVGYGPGLGGLYILSGDAQGRPAFADIMVDVVHSGPIETKLRMSAPVTVGDKKVNVTRYFTLIADDRTINDEVQVTGDNLDQIQIGIGVRDLPNCVWDEPVKDKGYGFQTGDANQPHYKAVGLGALFDPAQYVKTIELPAGDTAGHLYVLKGKKEEGDALVTRTRLSEVWDMDGQLDKPVEKAEELRAPFKSWFETWAAQRDNSVKVEISAQAEKK